MYVIIFLLICFFLLNKTSFNSSLFYSINSFISISISWRTSGFFLFLCLFLFLLLLLLLFFFMFLFYCPPYICPLQTSTNLYCNCIGLHILMSLFEIFFLSALLAWIKHPMFRDYVKYIKNLNNFFQQKISNFTFPSIS